MEHYAELAASMEETSFVLCKSCQSADWSEALAKFGKQAKSVEMMLFSNQLDALALSARRLRWASSHGSACGYG